MIDDRKPSVPLRHVRLPVTLAAIVLIVIPTFGAFYSVHGILKSAVAIGLNPAVDQELESAGKRLKEIAKLDPAREKEVRTEFDRLQGVRRDYGLLLETKPAVDQSLFQVFLIVFGFSLGLAIVLSWLLNRRIVRSYDLAIAKMRGAEKRAAYLETRESWRVVAQKMVHEVKNPLTPVQVMVGRLKKKYLESQAPGGSGFAEVLDETDQMVKEEVGKVNSWVEAFSKYARIPEPELTSVELRSFVDGVIRQFGEYWDTQTFAWVSRPERDVSVRTDPRLLRQILFNLAKNSVEAVPPGASAAIRFELSGGTETILLVSDDGPGIPADRAPKLFQPFQTTKAEGKGTGLGLAICKRIMVELGGDIRLSATPPRGTSFELLFSGENKS